MGGTSAQYFLDLFLLFNGVDPKAVTVVSLAPEALVPALIEGRVEALATFEPLAFRAMQALGDDGFVLHGARIYTETFNLSGLQSLIAAGDWRWYRWRGVALRDAHGRAHRMAGSMEDIHARREAGAERERLERQLRAAHKLEAIGTLTGGIAHDFNNILSAILGYGETVQKAATAGSPTRRHIDDAMEAAQRAKSLVQRILAFSRAGPGVRTTVAVRPIVDEVLEALEATLPAGVRIERQLEEAGYEPVGFTSAATALGVFRAAPSRFDAVLADDVMPGTSGTELAALLHRCGRIFPCW